MSVNKKWLFCSRMKYVRSYLYLHLHDHGLGRLKFGRYHLRPRSASRLTKSPKASRNLASIFLLIVDNALLITGGPKHPYLFLNPSRATHRPRDTLSCRVKYVRAALAYPSSKQCTTRVHLTRGSVVQQMSYHS